jgi:hypothetical protein
VAVRTESTKCSSKVNALVETREEAVTVPIMLKHKSAHKVVTIGFCRGTWKRMW